MPFWPQIERSRAIMVTILLLPSFLSDSAVDATENINTGLSNAPPFSLSCNLHYKCNVSPNKYVFVRRIDFPRFQVNGIDYCSLAVEDAIRLKTENFLNQQCAPSNQYNQSMITLTTTSEDGSCNVTINYVDIAYECVSSPGLTQTSTRRPENRTSAHSNGVLGYSVDKYSTPPFGLQCLSHYKCNSLTDKYVSMRKLSLTDPLSTPSASPCYSDVVENLKQQLILILNNECANGQTGNQLSIASATSACSNISFTTIQFDYECLPSPATTVSTPKTNFSGSNVLQATSNNTVEGKETITLTTSARASRDQVTTAGDALITQPPTQSSMVLIVAIAVPLSVLLVAAAALVAVCAIRKMLCFKGVSTLKQPQIGAPALPSSETVSAYSEPSDNHYPDIAFERSATSMPMNMELSAARNIQEYITTRDGYLIVLGTGYAYASLGVTPLDYNYSQLQAIPSGQRNVVIRPLRPPSQTVTVTC